MAGKNRVTTIDQLKGHKLIAEEGKSIDKCQKH